MDLCCKSSGFADFETIADRGSAVIFEADSGLCLSYVRTLGPKRNLDHKSFFSLDGHVNEFIQIISCFERSSFYLGCETVIGIVLCCCHQARCLLYYFGKIIIVVFTCTSLPLNFDTSIFGCGCGFGFEQKFWQIDGFDEKRHGSADLHTPIDPPPKGMQIVSL